MKSVKIILALLMVAMMAFGTFTAFASEGTLATEKADRFTVMGDDTDGDTFSMISQDGQLVIHINKETPIIFEDDTDARERLVEGQTLADLLNDRMLVVTYSIVATSYPPQTSPEKIVIMYEEAVNLPEDIDLGLDIDGLFLNGELVVSGEIIEAPAPYIKDGVVMVPLRAIAEKLGFDVNWDDTVRGVRLGTAINLWLGKDEYHVGRMAPISLGTAPELTDGYTFVPMQFFGSVVAGYDAYAFEGQVVIIASADNDMQ